MFAIIMLGLTVCFFWPGLLMAYEGDRLGRLFIIIGIVCFVLYCSQIRS